jgi:hypothetical protein
MQIVTNSNERDGEMKSKLSSNYNDHNPNSNKKNGGGRNNINQKVLEEKINSDEHMKKCLLLNTCY